MNCKFLSYTLLCLAFLGTDIAANAQAASSGAKAVKLEHMDYFHARKIILGYGWKPVGGALFANRRGNMCTLPRD